MKITLLALALQLLISAQQPNIPQKLRFEAINLASQIVTYSQQIPETTLQIPYGSVQQLPPPTDDGCGFRIDKKGNKYPSCS